MAQTEHYLASDAIHPIDIAEAVAAHHQWDFDRVTDDQIAMAVEGQWRSYSLTLAWSGAEEVLRLICTFDMDPPEGRRAQFYEVLNLANDQVWDGGFTYWAEQRLVVWRYGLVLTGETVPTPAQVDRMIGNALIACERFYPSFQLVGWGDVTPAAALDIAMGEAYGRA